MGILKKIIPYLWMREIEKKIEEIKKEQEEKRRQTTIPAETPLEKVYREELQPQGHPLFILGAAENMYGLGKIEEGLSEIGKTHREWLLRNAPYTLETPERYARARLVGEAIGGPLGVAAALGGFIFIPHPERVTINQALQEQTPTDRQDYMAKVIDNYFKTETALTIHAKLQESSLTIDDKPKNEEIIRKIIRYIVETTVKHYGLPIIAIPNYELLKPLLLKEWREEKPITKERFYQIIKDEYNKATEKYIEENPTHLTDPRKYTFIKLMYQLIPLAQKHPHELIDAYELLKPLEEAVIRGELKLEQIQQLLQIQDPQQLKTKIEELAKPLIQKYIQEAKKEEEKREEIKPSETLKIAIREQLPGWAIKTALDEEKRNLYTDPQGVHHSLIKYHLIRTSPDHPQGTALHPILLTLTGEWERQLHAGLNPLPPLKLLNDIAKRATGKSLDKIDTMDDRELQSLASELGLPQTLTPQTVREALKELYRDLKQLEQGGDPHQLDAEKEAAIRHLQLKLLAGEEQPHPEAVEIARRNLHTITDLYRELKRSILEETQLGREEQEKLLTIIENMLPAMIEKYKEMLGSRRVSSIVSDLTKEFRKKLEEEGIDPQARAWATNLIRNLLLDAPIIAAARDPTTTWKPLHEKKKIAAGLAKLYEEEARKHKIAPISADIYWMYNNIRDVRGEEALERVLSMKNRINTVQSAALQSHSGFRSVMETHFPNKEGFLSHEVIPKLQKVKKRLFETTYPRITKKG